jgi:hypothetical protein
MAIDQTKIGAEVAAQMEAIESQFGDDCEIGDVCFIVEVLGPHGSQVRVRNSGARPHIGLGLLRVAEATLLGGPGTSRPEEREE